MKKNLLSVAAFAVFGLIVGYAIFGKWGGQYVSLKTLFSFGDSGLQGAFRSISGLNDMRDRILLCGVAGAVVGVLATSRFRK